MRPTLEDRARRVRERELIRRWEYRQRNHAAGVWYRLRRVLVDAAEAWVLTEEEANRLARDGRVPLPVGAELEPSKRIFVVPVEGLAGLPEARRIPVRLCVDFLRARCVALVPHPDDDRPPSR